MANTIQVNRGAFADVPSLNAGEFGFTTDTYQLYVGDGTTNHEIVLDISPIESIDASNISGVVFTKQDGSTITESFGHHHEDYSLITHNHDNRYYTETESDAKYLLNITDTLTGTLTVTAGIEAATAKLTTGAALNKVLTSDANGNATWETPTTGTVTGNGTDGYIPNWNGIGSILEDSPIYTNGTNVGIGTVSPLSKLSINGGLHVGGDSDAGDNNLLVDATITGADIITGGLRVTDNKANGYIAISDVDGDLIWTDPTIYIDTWRGIDDTPVNGETADSITSNWAFDHNAGTGNLKHVPADPTDNTKFLRGDGTWVVPGYTSVTPAALTKTDDTNVTLTLGGTPATSLLQATSLTLGWTGTLADGRIATSGNWNTAYTNRITSLTTTGTSGAATLAANTLNIPVYANDNLYLDSIDASNISGVVFTFSDATTITESFGHHHEEYALSTETVIPNTEVVFGDGTGITSDANLTWDGSTLDITGSLGIDSSLIDYQENLDVDTGVETIYTLPVASYTAFFFDYVVTKGANARSGTVMAVVNSTTVEYTETSTNDIGNTSDVVLSVAISGSDLLLQSTTGSDDWIVKVLTRVI